jgi:hypothetical protein
MSPPEKAAFQRYRRWEKDNPHLAFPDQFKRWNEEVKAGQQQGTTFTIELARAMADEDYEATEAERAKRLTPHSAMGSIPETGPTL